MNVIKNQMKIDPAALVPMDLFADALPLRVDVAYTQPAPKSFCGVIYRPDARLWLHRDLALAVIYAAKAAAQAGYGMILYDGLRTVEAQAAMRETPIVQANPQWLAGETRMLSPPGKGAHPRGMAIDLTLCGPDGVPVDMGTAFDAMPPGGAGPGPDTNPAHRESPHIGESAQENRTLLTRFMTDGALRAGQFMLPLPQEWWDYRLMPMVYDRYEALSDAVLPPQMRMTGDAPHMADAPVDFGDAHFGAVRDALLKQAGL
jgi:D-alanyl-D-alanine dipeptidase